MLASLKKNRVGILFMVCSSFCVCLGQLFWKLSKDRGALWLILGFGLYGIGALAMIIGYKFGKVSILQPILSLNYILSIVLGAVVLNETITWQKCLGVLIIFAGVVLIAGGDEVEKDAAV